MLLPVVLFLLKFIVEGSPDEIPPNKCPLYFLEMPTTNACEVRCQGGRMWKESIFCLGHLRLDKMKQVDDVCICLPALKSLSCHMPRRDVCIYPAQSQEECRTQARGFEFSWECRATINNITDFPFERPQEYPARMWYCNTNLAPQTNPVVGVQLSTWSGVSCLATEAPTPAYPPIPDGYVMVGEYSFFNLWSYNNLNQWLYFFVVIVWFVLFVFFLCIGCKCWRFPCLVKKPACCLKKREPLSLSA